MHCWKDEDYGLFAVHGGELGLGGRTERVKKAAG